MNFLKALLKALGLVKKAETLDKKTEDDMVDLRNAARAAEEAAKAAEERAEELRKKAQQ